MTIDQMLEVTGHGKDEADGHGGVFKNWLLGEMKRGDISAGAPLEAADVVDGQVADVAEVLCAHAQAGLTDLKPAAMNSKRRAASNLKDRHFRTYTEADIGDARSAGDGRLNVDVSDAAADGAEDGRTQAQRHVRRRRD